MQLAPTPAQAGKERREADTGEPVHLVRGAASLPSASKRCTAGKQSILTLPLPPQTSPGDSPGLQEMLLVFLYVADGTHNTS